MACRTEQSNVMLTFRQEKCVEDHSTRCFSHVGARQACCTLEHRFEEYKWANSARLAITGHVFMAVAWLLGLGKVLKWAGTVAAGNEVAGMSPLGLSPLLVVAALQAASIVIHTLTALGLFCGTWREDRLRSRALMLTIAATSIIRCCMGPGFDQLFAGMAFSGLIVPAGVTVLDQLRLVVALPVHATNTLCYVSLVAIQHCGLLDLGFTGPPLRSVALFLGAVVILPIATTSVLEARERQWAVEFESEVKMAQLLSPYWTKVLAVVGVGVGAWRQLRRIWRDILIGFTL